MSRQSYNVNVNSFNNVKSFNNVNASNNVNSYNQLPPAGENHQNQGQSDPREGKWSYRDWLVKAVIPILVALIGAGVIFGPKVATPSPSAPASSGATIPALHATYTGSLTDPNYGIGATFNISQLTEDAQGNFQASATTTAATTGTMCTGQITGGKVDSTNQVVFRLETSDSWCTPQTSIFTGHVDSAGAISGTWVGENTTYNGNFNLS